MFSVFEENSRWGLNSAHITFAKQLNNERNDDNAIWNPKSIKKLLIDCIIVHFKNLSCVKAENFVEGKLTLCAPTFAYCCKSFKKSFWQTLRNKIYLLRAFKYRKLFNKFLVTHLRWKREIARSYCLISSHWIKAFAKSSAKRVYTFIFFHWFLSIILIYWENYFGNANQLKAHQNK